MSVNRGVLKEGVAKWLALVAEVPRFERYRGSVSRTSNVMLRVKVKHDE